MTRILLVSDTHGKLSPINRLALENNCEAVIHAGDFGFSDDESIGRLSDREVALHIRHSELNPERKKEILAQPPAEQREFVKRSLPLSELPDFLRGEKKFDVPIYAVWGNHEDVDVIRRFRCGDYAVDRLHLLHEAVSYHMGHIHIFGLGGNFLVGKKLWQTPIAGGRGKVWSVLPQYAQLVETVQANRQPDEIGIFVSHVSPGKEPFITLIGAQAGCGLIVSGHMDPPLPMVWNEFAIREPQEAVARLEGRLKEIEATYSALDDTNRQAMEFAWLRVQTVPKGKLYVGRRHHVPEWFIRMLNVNLPDAAMGHAILETAGTEFQITPSAGHIRISAKPEGD
ncbi:MAG: metallophosphoesterase [Kiritimatiellae bacterium]|nr:metallophosphoesterase [Kiritimatiellia bacterium]HNU02276.1 metallophosphoesterase [Acidobacteriota bacterium]HQQ61529.1 metallophosphoesterase [Kiritimatiellia bacterium]